MESTYFSTMAQLAGVIVGFANLANVIYRPDITAKEFHLNKIRILASTELGLINIIVCVLPIVFQSTSVSQVSLMKTLSVLLMIGVPLYAFAGTSRSARLMGTRFPVPFYSKFYLYSGFFCGAIAGLNACEIFGNSNLLFVYEMMVFYCFLLQSFLFIRLIHWILSTQEVNR